MTQLIKALIGKEWGYINPEAITRMLPGEEGWTYVDLADGKQPALLVGDLDEVAEKFWRATR